MFQCIMYIAKLALQLAQSKWLSQSKKLCFSALIIMSVYLVLLLVAKKKLHLAKSVVQTCMHFVGILQIATLKTKEVF